MPAPFTLRSPAYGEIHLEQEGLAHFVRAPFGEMSFREKKGTSFSLWHSTYHVHETITCTATAPIHVRELHTLIDGKQKSAGFSQFPFIDITTTLHAGQNFQTFDLHPDDDFLDPYVNVYPKLEHALNEGMHDRPAIISDGLTLTGPLQLILHQLMHPALTHPRYLNIKAEEYFLATMEALHETKKRTSPPFLLTAALREKAETIEAALHTRPDQPWSLDELRKLVASNIQTIQLAFKARYHTTIMDYQMDLRLQLVMQLLLDTNMDLESIAAETGFYDKSSLSNAFKRKFHTAPGRFRQR